MKAPRRWILIELKVLKAGRRQSKKGRACAAAAACSSLFSQEGALFIHLRGARRSTAPLSPALGRSPSPTVCSLPRLCLFLLSLSECFRPSLLVDTSRCHFLPIFYLIHLKTSSPTVALFNWNTGTSCVALHLTAVLPNHHHSPSCSVNQPRPVTTIQFSQQFSMNPP